jgi:hypothetical protein
VPANNAGTQTQQSLTDRNGPSPASSESREKDSIQPLRPSQLMTVTRID